jgi:hypothetical protein
MQYKTCLRHETSFYADDDSPLIHLIRVAVFNQMDRSLDIYVCYYVNPRRRDAVSLNPHSCI